MDSGNRKNGTAAWKMAVRAMAVWLAALSLVWPGPVRAEESVYFVAADEIVLPLSDDTMPFWEGGCLYISGSLFTDAVAVGAARRNLEISLSQNNDQDRVILYRGTDSLDFEMGVNFAVDPEGEIHYPGAIWRNGRVFVPASLTANYFGLLYSVIPVEHGSLIWLRHPSFRLQERAFADAASYQLNSSYQEYLDAKAPPAFPPEPADSAEPAGGPEPSGGPTPEKADTRSAAPVPNPADTSKTAPQGAEPPEPADTPQSGDTPEPADIPQPPEEPEIPGGVDLYLCFRSGARTSALLDILDAAGLQASFFCDRSFLAQQGELVRRMAAEGHTVGLYLTGTAAANTPPDAAANTPPDAAVNTPPDAAGLAQQAAELSALTEYCACLRTHLAYVENGTEADREILRALGYVCPPLTVPASADSQEGILREAGAQGVRAAVWLGDAENASDLLDAAAEEEDRCLPLTETAFP